MAAPHILTLDSPENLWPQPRRCQRTKGAQLQPLGPLRVTEGTCPSFPSESAVKALSWERRGRKESELYPFIPSPSTPIWGTRLVTPGNVPAAYSWLGQQGCSATVRVREILSPHGI